MARDKLVHVHSAYCILEKMTSHFLAHINIVNIIIVLVSDPKT